MMIDAWTEAADHVTSRRYFLSRAPAFLAGIALVRPDTLARRIVHPEPRDGIDASGVLPPERIEPFGEQVMEIYDMIREIPQIADGIGCACGCAALPGYRSLLTCYHEGGMAFGCPICQGEARLAYRRHSEGQSLERIRAAIDARYG